MVYYPFEIFLMLFNILMTPWAAINKKDNGIIDFIKNLYGKPPGSGLDSKIIRESSTKGIEV